MAIIAEAVRHLMAAGVTGEALLLAISDMEAALPTAKDASAERRRERDRLRKRSLPKDWAEIRLHVLNRDGSSCCYCGDEDGPFHIDHVIPLSKGGASEPDNLAVACSLCNVRKKDKSLDEWVATWA